MSDWVKCDCCGKDRENARPIDATTWFHVERAVMLMGHRGDFDFCSWACMEAFAGAEKVRAWGKAMIA